MKTLAKALDIIDQINEWVGKALSFLIVILMIVVIYDVCLRYFLNSPTTWGLEFSGFLLVYVSLLGGGYCFLHGGQVKVDILYSRWSPRVKSIVDLATYLLFFIFVFVLVKYGGEVAWESIVESKRSTSIWGPLLWPSQIVVPLGGILIGLQGLAKWSRDWVAAVTGKNLLASKLVSGEGGIFAREED